MGQPRPIPNSAFKSILKPFSETHFFGSGVLKTSISGENFKDKI